MASFAPVYRLPPSQQSFLTREQRRERKRKRDADDEEEDDPKSDEEQLLRLEHIEDEPRVPHPVNRKDPYYVAGWPREKPLPGGSFPHAAVKEVKEYEPSEEEQLAGLNPPLYVQRTTPDDDSGSLRRKHLDNLTAILHKSMLSGDWQRASRVWGLILRTEIAGSGPDIRQHGRWMIGAELLMRRNQTLERSGTRPQTASSEVDSEHSSQEAAKSIPVISDEGFKLAREYYERLILQYPHQPRTPHSAISSKVIYPALFGIWVYEVQDRAKRTRNTMPSDNTEIDDTRSVKSDTSEQLRNRFQAKSQELEEALPIKIRLDELLISPPYDTEPELLELRGMVGMWLSDLHKQLASNHNASLSGTSDEDDETVGEMAQASSGRHQNMADLERARAKLVFMKMVDAKMPISDENRMLLEEEDDPQTAQDDSELYTTGVSFE